MLQAREQRGIQKRLVEPEPIAAVRGVPAIDVPLPVQMAVGIPSTELVQRLQEVLLTRSKHGRLENKHHRREEKASLPSGVS